MLSAQPSAKVRKKDRHVLLVLTLRRGRIAVLMMTRKAAKRSNCYSPGLGLKITGNLQLELLIVDLSHEDTC